MEIPCKFKRNESLTTFYVTDAPGKAILGLPTCQKLHLIKFNHVISKQEQDYSRDRQTITHKEDLIQQFSEGFDGIDYKITLDPNVPPVVHTPRRVPLSMKDDVKAELDEIEKNNIITKIKEGEATA